MDTNKTPEQLAAENAELKAKLEELEASRKVAGGLTEEQAKIVKEKIAAGLTREQAIEVLRQQEAWDADPANPKNAKKKGARE